MPVELLIEKMVYGGEGLSRVGGEVVFAPFVLPGERVEAERTGARQHAERARVVRIMEPSPSRVEPLCPYFGRCGGCQYQHAVYGAQLAFKRDILAETLRRVGKLEFDATKIAIEAGEPWRYRNRVQLHLDKDRIGYREMHSRRLVPIGQCPIASPRIEESIQKLNRMARDRRWPRFLQSIEIFTDETQVQWNLLESERPVAKHFFEWLAEEIPESVHGPLDYTVKEDRFTVSGQSFFQVNRFLLPRLAALVIGEAAGATAWDLYAGVGLFSLPLARRFERVVGVESGRAAAADLTHNAKRARLKVQVAQQQTEAFLMQAKNAPDFVLADPPRSGLGKTAVLRLLELAPREISIVACDPATLARDLAALSVGYEIERIAMVDLFPQTFHIEAIVNLTRSAGRSTTRYKQSIPDAAE